MPDVFLRAGEANPADVRLRDTTTADSGGAVDFTGTWTQAAASWAATASEDYPFTASFVQATASWAATATETFTSTATWTQAPASWSGSLATTNPSTATWVQAAASWAAAATQNYPTTATWTQAAASWQAVAASGASDLVGAWVQSPASWSASLASATARRRGWPLRPNSEPNVNLPHPYAVVAVEKITAKTLYDDLVERYGLYEGRQVYYAMRREQKGPFAEGAKYERDGVRAQTQVSTGIPAKPPAPDKRLREFAEKAAGGWSKR